MAEDQHQQNHAHRQQQIHAWDIDLAVIGGAGVADFHARKLAQLHRLLRHGEDAGNHRLRRDGGGHGREDYHRPVRPLRDDGEEGEAHQLGLLQDGGALAEIVQQQGRQRHEQPGILDRLAAEMAHIGIDRLAARHRQHDGAEAHERHPGRSQEYVQRIKRIDRQQNGGVIPQ